MVNVYLKVPALEMLLTYTASGIGAVAARCSRRGGRGKEADARLIETEGEAGSLKLSHLGALLATIEPRECQNYISNASYGST